MSGKGVIYGSSNGNELGYASDSSINGNHSAGCGLSACVANSSLILSEEPNFNPPNGATTIDLDERGGMLAGGIYKTNGNVTLKEGDSVIVTAPSTLYVNKLKVDGGGVDVLSDDPNDLLIVLKGDSEFIDGSTVHGHILAKKKLTIKDTEIFGSIVAKDLKLDSGGVVNGMTSTAPPEPPISDTCAIFPDVIQSWGGSSSLVLQSDVSLVGTRRNQGYVGCDSVHKAWEDQKACDGLDCIADDGLLVSTPNIVNLNVGTVDLINEDTPILEGYYDEIRLDDGADYQFSGGVYHIRNLNIGNSTTVFLKNPQN